MASWITNIVSSTGYLSIVLLMFVENVFPPIPSELIMPLAGFMVAQGKLSFFGVVIAGMIGSVLGALPLYYGGRKLGRERVKTFADKHGRWLTVSRADIERAETRFEKHGAAVILFGRLIPGVRSLISIPAGIGRMHLLTFVACTALGTGIWAALLAYLGYFLGSNFATVGRYLDPVSWIVLGLIGVAYVMRVIRRQ